jgi:DNA polymerase elongation subunit (family B)
MDWFGSDDDLAVTEGSDEYALNMRLHSRLRRNVERYCVTSSGALSFQILDVKLYNGEKPFPSTEEFTSAEDVWSKCSSNDFYMGDMDCDDEEETYKDRNRRRVVVFIFGIMDSGATITCRVSGFRPGIYVDLGSVSTAQARRKVEDLQSALNRQHLFCKVSVRSRRPLYGWRPVQNANGTFNPNEQQINKYAYIDFPNEKNLRQATYFLKRKKYQVQEVKIQPLQKFLMQRDLVASSWCSVETYQVCDRRTTLATIEIETNIQHLQSVKREDAAPLVLASIDIECDSADGGFPSSHRDPIINIGCTFYTFGAPAEDMHRVMLCLHETDDVEGVDVRWYAKERDLLNAFHDMMVFVDPSFVVSFNGSGFDWKYISDRNDRVSGGHRFLYLGRVFSDPSPLYQKELSSSALSQNILSFFPMVGRINLDVMQYFKSRCKFSSYSLTNITKELLGKDVGKVRLDLEGWGKREVALFADLLQPHCERGTVHPDTAKRLLARVEKWEGVPPLAEMQEAAKELESIKVTLMKQKTVEGVGSLFSQLNRALLSVGDDNYRKLFAMYRMSPSSRAKIVAYGVMDCVLPLQLIIDQTVVENLTAMSQVCHTLYSDILLRGQQIKVINQIYRFASPLGFVVEKSDVHWDPDAEFEGATVVEPKKGFYGQQNGELVVCLDFASLYPSIIRAYRLCYSNLVSGVKLSGLRAYNEAKERGVEERELNGILQDATVFGRSEYHEKCPTGTFDHYDLGGRRWTFATQTSGILPEICAELLKARKRRKKMMKEAARLSREATTEEGKHKYEKIRKVHDAFQLNLKISCNSVYGFTGVGFDKGMGSCLPISTATTYNGRKMIDDTKRFMEQHFNANVIYGDTDSVFVIFPNVSSVQRAFEIGIEAGERATESLWGDKNKNGKIIDLEFEKVYTQFLLLKKKNYVGLKYEGSPDYPPKIDAKGIPLVRRDNCQILRDALGGILDAVLKRGSPKEAEQILREVLRSLVQNRFDVSQYVITKTRKRDYKISNTFTAPLGFGALTAVHENSKGVLEYFTENKRNRYLKCNKTAPCITCAGCASAIKECRPSHVARALENYRQLPYSGQTRLRQLFREKYGKVVPDALDVGNPSCVRFLLRSCVSPVVTVESLEGGLCSLCHSNLTRQPHLTAISNMLVEKSFDVPGYGDRVPYIIVKGAGKMYESTKHPVYTDLKEVDRKYYFTNMLQKPLVKIIGPLLGEATTSSIMSETLRMLEQQVSGTRTLHSYWGSQVGQQQEAVERPKKKKKSKYRKMKAVVVQ